MIGIKVNIVSEDKAILQISKGREIIKKLNLIVGNEYIVNPLNPRKTRNRDRRVRVEGFVSNGNMDGKASYVKVRYLDNNRIGRADYSDLDLP